MNITVHLLSQSKGIIHNDVVNAYTKDGLYCVYLNTSLVYKYPMINIFRIEESY